MDSRGMFFTTTRQLTAAISAGLVLTFAACGGGSDETASTSDPPSTEPADQTDTAVTPETTPAETASAASTPEAPDVEASTAGSDRRHRHRGRHRPDQHHRPVRHRHRDRRRPDQHRRRQHRRWQYGVVAVVVVPR